MKNSIFKQGRVWKFDKGRFSRFAFLHFLLYFKISNAGRILLINFRFSIPTSIHYVLFDKICTSEGKKQNMFLKWKRNFQLETFEGSISQVSFMQSVKLHSHFLFRGNRASKENNHHLNFQSEPYCMHHQFSSEQTNHFFFFRSSISTTIEIKFYSCIELSLWKLPFNFLQIN